MSEKNRLIFQKARYDWLTKDAHASIVVPTWASRQEHDEPNFKDRHYDAR